MAVCVSAVGPPVCAVPHSYQNPPEVMHPMPPMRGLRRHHAMHARPHLVDERQRREVWEELYPDHAGVLVQEHLQVRHAVGRVRNLTPVQAVGFKELVEQVEIITRDAG